MQNKIELKRILIFLAFAFGIAWGWALLLAFNGGLLHSPSIVPFSSFTLAVVVLAGGYMTAPSIANLLTRLITKEGWKSAYFRPQFRRGWRFWVMAWFMPALLTIVGAAAFFLAYKEYYDPTMAFFSSQLGALAEQDIPEMPLMTLVLIQVISAVLVSPILNGVFTFGEEFGWRAYLLQKLLPLGGRKAVLISGVIWGVWHWPIIAMGHNYGLEYPGSPWLGMLLMVVFCVAASGLLSWMTLRAHSVWPAVIGHAAINGIAGIGLLFLAKEPNPLLGPAPTGIVGMLGFIAVAIYLMVNSKAFEVTEIPE